MSHPRRKPYSRVARILKARLRDALAPTVQDFELDRPRLGMTEREVRSGQRPRGDVIVVCSRHTNRASAAQTASPTTHGGTPRE